MSNKHPHMMTGLLSRQVCNAGIEDRTQIAKNIGKDLAQTVGREISTQETVSLPKVTTESPSSPEYQNPELSFRLFFRKETVPDSMWTMPGRMP